jgi:signal transduction histidine kinase
MREGSIKRYRSSFLTKAGESLAVLLSGEIIEFRGELCAMIAAEDIGLRVQAEGARLELNRRLLKAQETERTRVARELHDNIGQSLAVFSLELEKTRNLVRPAMRV